MAQNEDTELRDLVIDALEKNGSLAKIRALLRANIFLAFEDECHLKQNEALNKILSIPEGKLCLSIIHEFLDYCNLRNTLFVYKSETRQGKEYEYQSENIIAEKLCISKNDGGKEPILLSLIKNNLNLRSNKTFKQNDIHNNGQNKVKRSFGNDENCTYIVHGDSSTTSQSQSDNSSDEKNKLDLRLHLDNSDTDTSSSSKCKSSSEYIPNKNLANAENDDKRNTTEKNNMIQVSTQNNSSYNNNKNSITYLHDLKLINNSSDSTSYAELKPFNSIDTILLNTTGLPLSSEKEVKQISPHNNSNSTSSKIESLSLNHTMDSNSVTLEKESQHSNKSINSLKKSLQPEGEIEVTEYSYDFTSPLSERKEISERNRHIQEALHDNNMKSDTSLVSPKQNSLSSQSSVSISDVADLISETSSKKYSLDKNISDKSKLSSHKFNKSPRDGKILSDDSGDFSESPIPSLSNLSLDIHSE